MPLAELADLSWNEVAPMLAFLALGFGLHAARRWRRPSAPRPRKAFGRRPRPVAVPVARGGSARRLGLALVGAGGIAMVALAATWWWLDGPPGNSGTALAGVVTHVRDGDTIEVARRPIRLSGLTCDERGTLLGDRATAAMRRLVQGRPVHCVLNGERTHDREVGRCRLVDGEDLGAMMIASRLCGRCARHDPSRDYAALQAEVGPFSGDNPGYCRSLW